MRVIEKLTQSDVELKEEEGWMGQCQETFMAESLMTMDITYDQKMYEE